MEINTAPIIFCCLAACCCKLWAQPWPEIEALKPVVGGEFEPVNKAAAPKPKHWLVRSQEAVSNRWLATTQAVDAYFAGNQGAVVNESYLRLRVSQLFEEGGESSVNNDLKVRVDLPRTQKRYKLVFDSSPDDDESLKGQDQDRPDNERRLKDEGSSGALRIVLNEWQAFKPDVDVGVRGPLPLDVFLKFRLRRDFKLTEAWYLRWRGSLYHFHQEGPGSQGRFDIGRPIGENWHYNNSLQAKWQHDERMVEYSDVSTFTQWLTDRNTLFYSAGAFYQERPRPELQSYFVEVKFRRRLHDDWLFVELTPSVNWDHERDYKAQAAVNLRLEMFFKR